MSAPRGSEITRNPFLTSPEGVNTERGEWVMQANCRNGDPDALFVRGAAQRRAAVICRQCPVIVQCRADALDNKVEFGGVGLPSASAGPYCGKIPTLRRGQNI